MSNFAYILADWSNNIKNNAQKHGTGRFLQQETSTLVTVFYFLTRIFLKGGVKATKKRGRTSRPDQKGQKMKRKENEITS